MSQLPLNLIVILKQVPEIQLELEKEMFRCTQSKNKIFSTIKQTSLTTSAENRIK